MSIFFGSAAKTPSLPNRLFLGLDLGQRADHSTLLLLERTQLLTGEFDHAHWRPATRLALVVRALHRWPLGAPYLDIAERTREALAEYARNCRPGAPVTLALDAAGPGAPVFELLRRARTGAQLEPVLITSGQQPGRSHDGVHLIPREHLFSTLRMVFERGLLVVPPKLPFYAQLEEELASLGQPGAHAHDDLAISLALAVHSALRSLR